MFSLNPSRRLANGSPVKLHSITYNDQEADEMLRELISSHTNGEIIDVIPILAAEMFPDIARWGRVEIPYLRFQIELGFAITFHKVQGKTLDKIILCLNRRKGRRMPNISLTSFLVGYSRVRTGANIRRNEELMISKGLILSIMFI